MNQFNPSIHHRRSARLKGYDYSDAGLYFITICVHDRACLFGEIENGKMVLNAVGKIADDYWLNIQEHFPHVVLHEYIVMPNHLHGIIEIVGIRHDMNDAKTRHGVSLPANTGNTVGTSHGMSNNVPDGFSNGTFNELYDKLCHGMDQPPTTTPQPAINQFGKPVAGSVPVIINQYKSSVKRWCNKNGHSHFQWQSRFHDHIIRNEGSYQRISEYIMNNPTKWQNDKFFMK